MKPITILEVRIAELESSIEKKEVLMKAAEERREKDEAIVKHYHKEIQEIKSAISKLQGA